MLLFGPFTDLPEPAPEVAIASPVVGAWFALAGLMLFMAAIREGRRLRNAGQSTWKTAALLINGGIAYLGLGAWYRTRMEMPLGFALMSILLGLVALVVLLLAVLVPRNWERSVHR